jgi:hypothetical protein
MRRALAILLAGYAPLAALLPLPAHAVTMQVTVLDHHQVGTGPAFTLGEFIDARSWAQNLTVSGSFRVTCQDPNVSPITGGNSGTQTVLLQQNVLSMGVPDSLPAQRSLSGWTRVPTGSVVACIDEWQARAVESGINFGTGGGSIPIGFGERSESGTEQWDMVKVGTYPGPGCIF